MPRDRPRGAREARPDPRVARATPGRARGPQRTQRGPSRSLDGLTGSRSPLVVERVERVDDATPGRVCRPLFDEPTHVVEHDRDRVEVDARTIGDVLDDRAIDERSTRGRGRRRARRCRARARVASTSSATVDVLRQNVDALPPSTMRESNDAPFSMECRQDRRGVRPCSVCRAREFRDRHSASASTTQQVERDRGRRR